MEFGQWSFEVEDYNQLKKGLQTKCDEIKSLRLEIEKVKQEDVHAVSVPISSQPTSTSTVINNAPLQQEKQVMVLQEKLKHATKVFVDQERFYESSFKDMELKLRRAIASRDQLLKLRDSESNNQQQLIHHLQSALEKLEKDNKTLEENKEAIQANAEVLKTEIGLERNGKENFEKQIQYVLSLYAVDDSQCIQSNDLISSLEKLLNSYKDKVNRLTEENTRNAHKLESTQMLNEERSTINKELMQLKGEKETLHYDIIAKEKVNWTLNQKLTLLESTFEKEKAEYNLRVDNMQQLHAQAENNHKYEKSALVSENDILKKKVNEINSNLENATQDKNNIELQLNTLRKSCDDFQEENKALKEQLKTLNAEKVELITIKKTLEQQLSELKKQYKHDSDAQKNKLKVTEEREVELSGQLNRINSENLELKSAVKNLSEKNNQTYCSLESLRSDYEAKLKEILCLVDENKLVKTEAESLKSQVGKTKEEICSLSSKKQQTIVNIKKSHNLEKAALIHRCEALLSRLQDLTVSEATLKNELENTVNLLTVEKNKVGGLEKNNIELLGKSENLKIQVNNLEDESKKLHEAMGDKQKEVAELKRERRQFAKKLKIKTEMLATVEKQSKELSENLQNASKDFRELEYQYANRRREYDKLFQDNQYLLQQKVSLEENISRQDEAQRNEIMKLIKRLNGSKDDIHFLKNLLKNHKDADTKVMQAATLSQKVVTKQRTEIDTLKSNVHWLKEALEVSEKEREDALKLKDRMEKELHLLKESYDDHEIHIGQLQRDIHESNQECIHLHRLLEKAAMKYRDIHELVEKQETVLHKDINVENQRMPHYSEKPVNEIPVVPTINYKELAADMNEILTSTLQSLNNKPVDNLQQSTERVMENYRSVSPVIFHNSQKLEEYIEKFSSVTSDLFSHVESPEMRTDVYNDLSERTSVISHTSSDATPRNIPELPIERIAKPKKVVQRIVKKRTTNTDQEATTSKLPTSTTQARHQKSVVIGREPRTNR